MLEINELYQGDCLELMHDIDDKSIDMILCDLPYGTTACKWDSVIPFEPLWAHYKRIIKDNGAIVLTASQPFTSMLVMSNIKMFKYEWIWVKSKSTDFFNAKNKPLKKHESVLVFSNGTTANRSDNKMLYKPQGTKPYNKIVKGDRKGGDGDEHKFQRDSHKAEHLQENTNYPNSMLRFNSVSNPLHGTQKPVALFEYLIKTYTNEGELVLDNCAGSGTTAIACLGTNRNYILMEQEQNYCDIANKRIADILELS